MPYQVPPDVEEKIRAHVASGEFANEDDVVREAIEALERRQRSLEELRAMVAEADADIAAGRFGPFDADETMREVKERLAEHGIE